MAKMVNPELEIVRFENEDVIAASDHLYFDGTKWSHNYNGTITVLNGDESQYSVQNGAGSDNSVPIGSWNGGSGHWIWRNGRYEWVGNQ